MADDRYPGEQRGSGPAAPAPRNAGAGAAGSAPGRRPQAARGCPRQWPANDGTAARLPSERSPQLNSVLRLPH